MPLTVVGLLLTPAGPSLAVCPPVEPVTVDPLLTAVGLPLAPLLTAVGLPLAAVGPLLTAVGSLLTAVGSLLTVVDQSAGILQSDHVVP